MIRFIYNLLWPIGLLLFLPSYLAKMLRRGGYRKNFGQRLGFYSSKCRKQLHGKNPTWIHAVSVGEIVIALKLAEELRALQPNLKCILTTTTTTGYALAQKAAPEWIDVLYAPLDFWPIMRRAFALIRPTRIVFVEAEVWPNMTAIAHRARIPLALVNARLSPRSESRFRKFKWFVKPYFQMLDLVCVQEPEDVARWTSLGAIPSRIDRVGSIKFDPENVEPQPNGPRAVLEKLGIDRGRPILLAGSTHRGEEEILGRILLELRREFSDLFLVIAPRHVERAREIASQLHAIGLTALRRTGGGAGASDCLLLDTTGELRDWYSIATVVFIGKSLTAHGGQNPVEAIVAGRPVVFGPHMENFASLARGLVVAEGALQPNDELALTTTLASLLRDPARRERLACNAHHVLDQHRGATDRTARLLENPVARAT
jgi:3-deoxy-D-manno-octulosonic-acid transferase